MTTNASTDLKFGPDMYFYVFYQILEDLCKIFKIDQFMAKNHLACFSRYEIVAEK